MISAIYQSATNWGFHEGGKVPLTTENTTQNPIREGLTTALKAGGALLATGGLGYLAYHRFYSPTLSSHDIDQSPLTAFYQKYSNSCESRTFKVMQSFLNAVEKPLFANANTPPGALKAFLLDRNLDGARCAYAAYPEGKITQGMKNSLLGEVMHQMQANGKDLKASLKWLIDIGADVNFSQRIMQKDLRQNEDTYTALLTAYRSRDADLFESLIKKGANPDLSVHSYSKLTERFDNKQPIIKAMVEDMGRTGAQMPSKDTCSSYKKMVDLSIQAHTQAMGSFAKETQDTLKPIIYQYLNGKVCFREFFIKRTTPPPKKNSSQFSAENNWSNLFNSFGESARVYLEALNKLWDDFFPEIAKEDQEDAYRILGLDPVELGKMSSKEALKTIKKACRELHKVNHPDRGGDSDLFTKVTDACEKTTDEQKKGRFF